VHSDAETPLRAWYAEASRATWRTPGDIKQSHRNASVLPNNRVVFKSPTGSWIAKKDWQASRKPLWKDLWTANPGFV